MWFQATGRSTLPIGEHGFRSGTRRLLLQRMHRAWQPWRSALKTWTIDPQVTEDCWAFRTFASTAPRPTACSRAVRFEMHQAGFKKDSPIKRIAMRGGMHVAGITRNSISTSRSVTSCVMTCAKSTAA